MQDETISRAEEKQLKESINVLLAKMNNIEQNVSKNMTDLKTEISTKNHKTTTYDTNFSSPINYFQLILIVVLLFLIFKIYTDDSLYGLKWKVETALLKVYSKTIGKICFSY